MPSNLPAGAPEGVRTIIVIPTYNEAENLPSLIAELVALGVPGLMVLVVDDNSPDGTGRVADCLAERLPGVVQVMHRAVQGRPGPRWYIAGFSRALAEEGADFVVQMDADFSHPAAAIPSMFRI